MRILQTFLILAIIALAGRLNPQNATGKEESESRQAQGAILALHEGFAEPPDDCRIMMRWWWFGPAATSGELRRELQEMKAAGIGGVEVATLYPLALDDPGSGFHNYDFLSEEHLQNIRFAADEARKLGLRFDITLGSGWPFGGPHIPVTQAAGELRVETVAAPAGATSIAAPALESGEQLIAAFEAPGDPGHFDIKQATKLPSSSGPRLKLHGEASADHTIVFFVSSRTGMMVKRPAQGAAGFVLDHFDAAAIQNHLHAVGDRLLSVLGDHPPYAVFSDSLEDYGSDWTPDLLFEFQRRRGYDLVPFLPALIGDNGPDTAGVRHDWGQTLTELANERFLEPMHRWAHEHHTLLRSQTYGFPPVTLSSNRYADLPEGEGKADLNMWRDFSDTRWASSAGHLFNRPVISSETWTWLHSPAFRATPLDMKAEADLHFLQGINQLVGHGWPYSPQSAGEPGWKMYAAGALNAHNPWFFVMPDLSRYLQRVSFALRQGRPANDVAILLPNDDVWASFKARFPQIQSPTSVGGFDETGSNVTVDESMHAFLGTEVIPQVLDAGFNFDFIDADAIDTVGIPYRAIVLPAIDRIPPRTYERILKFARQGGLVIATRHEPSTAPGHVEAAAVSAQIMTLSRELFHSNFPTAHFVPDEKTLGESLASWLRPDFNITPSAPEIGFIHRHLDNGDLYFIANTSSRTRQFEANFRSVASHAEIWDPFTGLFTGVLHPDKMRFDLEPYGSRILFFSDAALAAPLIQSPVAAHSIDISSDWQVALSDTAIVELPTLKFWTEDPRLRDYSGVATYSKTFDVASSDLQASRSIELDFGTSNPIPVPDPLPHFNMSAYLDNPVREAAQVFVNGQFAGYIWRPPFRVAINSFLKPGKNNLRVLVGNTAINALAGASVPSYRLLYDRYGVEFIPQDVKGLEWLPSGLRGPVTLILTSGR